MMLMIRDTYLLDILLILLDEIDSIVRVIFVGLASGRHVKIDRMSCSLREWCERGEGYGNEVRAYVQV